jgi:hypothetical protein
MDASRWGGVQKNIGIVHFFLFMGGLCDEALGGGR